MTSQATAGQGAARAGHALVMYHALEVIGSQSPGPDYSVGAALGFCKQHARETLHVVRNGTVPADLQPAGGVGLVLSVVMQDVVGDYDTPDRIPEWQWIARNASLAHKDNGRAGVWEFMLNLAPPVEGAPGKLRDLVSRARSHGYAYILFHQGT